MTYSPEPRMYQRYDASACEVRVSTDKVKWDNIEVTDISASGLRFTSKKSYELETQLNFELSVYNVLSEFVLKVEGHVVKVGKSKDKFTYAARFTNLNKHDQVQLDEILKSNITVNTDQKHLSEDGVYSFMFLPGVSR